MISANDLSPAELAALLHFHADAGVEWLLEEEAVDRFAYDLRWKYAEGIYRTPAGTLHVSPGLGTTFVPFRFFARPVATALGLERQV